MTGVGSTPRTQKELIRNQEKRMRAQERRLVPQALRPDGRLGVAIGAAGDLNELTQTGWYQSAGPTSSANRPAEADALGLGSLEIQVVALASGSVFQTARTHGAVGDPYRWEWVRDFRGTFGWSEWRSTRRPTVTYSPTIVGGATLGNGSLSGRWEMSDGLVTGQVRFNMGSTSSIHASGDLILAAPTPMDSAAASRFGRGRFYDASASTYYDAVVLAATSGIYIRTAILSSNGSSIVQRSITASIPIPFTTSDWMEASFVYPAKF